MDLENLSIAFKEHCNIDCKYLDKTKITINGILFESSGYLVKSKKVTFRTKNLKIFITTIIEAGIIPQIDNAVINHIVNRYRHLTSNKQNT